MDGEAGIICCREIWPNAAADRQKDGPLGISADRKEAGSPRSGGGGRQNEAGQSEKQLGASNGINRTPNNSNKSLALHARQRGSRQLLASRAAIRGRAAAGWKDERMGWRAVGDVTKPGDQDGRRGSGSMGPGGHSGDGGGSGERYLDGMMDLVEVRDAIYSVVIVIARTEARQ